MKNLNFVFISFGLALLFYTELSAQSNIYIKSEMRYSMIKNTFRGELALGVGKNFETYGISAKGLISLISNSAESLSNRPKLTGVGVDFQYYIPTAKPWLSLSAYGELAYSLYPSTWNANYFSEANSYVNVATSSLEHFMSLMVGYGMHVELGKYFYLENILQLGIFHSRLHKGRALAEESLSQSVVRHDFRRYKDWGWKATVALTIGYKF